MKNRDLKYNVGDAGYNKNYNVIHLKQWFSTYEGQRPTKLNYSHFLVHFTLKPTYLIKADATL